MTSTDDITITMTDGVDTMYFHLKSTMVMLCAMAAWGLRNNIFLRHLVFMHNNQVLDFRYTPERCGLVSGDVIQVHRNSPVNINDE